MARYSAFQTAGFRAHGSRGTVPSTDPDYPGWCIAEYASTAHEESILSFSVVLATWRNPGKGGAAAVSPFCCLGRGAPTSHDPNAVLLFGCWLLEVGPGETLELWRDPRIVAKPHNRRVLDTLRTGDYVIDMDYTDVVQLSMCDPTVRVVGADVQAVVVGEIRLTASLTRETFGARGGRTWRWNHAALQSRDAFRRHRLAPGPVPTGDCDVWQPRRAPR